MSLGTLKDILVNNVGKYQDLIKEKDQEKSIE